MEGENDGYVRLGVVDNRHGACEAKMYNFRIFEKRRQNRKLQRIIGWERNNMKTRRILLEDPGTSVPFVIGRSSGTKKLAMMRSVFVDIKSQIRFR